MAVCGILVGAPEQNSGKSRELSAGPATTQNLVVKFDGEICGGVLEDNASDDFPQQKKLQNLLTNFAGSSPPISPKTSPTSLWRSLVLISGTLHSPPPRRCERVLRFMGREVQGR